MLTYIAYGAKSAATAGQELPYARLNALLSRYTSSRLEWEGGVLRARLITRTSNQLPTVTVREPEAHQGALHGADARVSKLKPGDPDHDF
jgi:hypothetical protein